MVSCLLDSAAVVASTLVPLEDCFLRLLGARKAEDVTRMFIDVLLLTCYYIILAYLDVPAADDNGRYKGLTALSPPKIGVPAV